jgi:small-conductance mechanosensitive channel
MEKKKGRCRMKKSKKASDRSVYAKWIAIGIIVGFLLGCAMLSLGLFAAGESPITLVVSWTVWGFVAGLITGFLKVLSSKRASA